VVVQYASRSIDVTSLRWAALVVANNTSRDAGSMEIGSIARACARRSIAGREWGDLLVFRSYAISKSYHVKDMRA
jgi:hypothetical protein